MGLGGGKGGKWSVGLGGGGRGGKGRGWREMWCKSQVKWGVCVCVCVGGGGGESSCLHAN